MEVLLTNDDGIQAPGIQALYAALAQQEHRVSIVAPDRERSAVGHAITLDRPLRAARMTVANGDEHLAVNGTPADCVKIGLAQLLERRPQIVISGINRGANTGMNIFYSGTVAAAREAAMAGLPAIAVSLDGQKGQHFEVAAAFIAGFLRRFGRSLASGICLNINIPDLPADARAGVRVCRLATQAAAETFDRRIDPRQGVYYWQGSQAAPVGPSAMTGEPDEPDQAALERRYITITPLKIDLTDDAVMETLTQWKIDI